MRCAKVYKEADKRSFRQAVDYTENRKTKNSRQARAMAKGTRFGRESQEKAWQSAEVDALYRLAAAGVRVPRPYNFHDGVLLMELVTDDAGNAAPRLNDVELTPEIAIELHQRLIREVVRMLSAGIVHGDLSEFNILLGADGPVIIDLPQAVDAAGNNHAPRMLLRDVDNLRRHFGRYAPGATRHRLRQGDLGALRVGHAASGRRVDRTVRAQGEGRRPGERHARNRRGAPRGSRPATADAGTRLAELTSPVALPVAGASSPRQA